MWSACYGQSSTGTPTFACVRGEFTLELRSDRDPSWFAVDDLDVTTAPEPGTLILFGTGLAAVARRFRRQQ